MFFGSVLIDVFSQRLLEAVALHHSHLHFDYVDLSILIIVNKRKLSMGVLFMIPID